MWLSLCFRTAVQPVPHPLLFPCCLPKPLPTPRLLQSPFSFISAPARPGANLRELESGLPSLASALHVNANAWLHKSPTEWDVNHISRSLFAGVKQTERERGEERGEWWTDGEEIVMKRNKPQQMDCFLSTNLLNMHSFCVCFFLAHCTVVYYSLPLIQSTQTLYLLSWTMLCFIFG